MWHCIWNKYKRQITDFIWLNMILLHFIKWAMRTLYHVVDPRNTDARVMLLSKRLNVISLITQHYRVTYALSRPWPAGAPVNMPDQWCCSGFPPWQAEFTGVETERSLWRLVEITLGGTGPVEEWHDERSAFASLRLTGGLKEQIQQQVYFTPEVTLKEGR